MVRAWLGSHMGKPSSAYGWSGGFPRVLQFSHTLDERSAWYKWNILERAVKPKSIKTKKKKKYKCTIVTVQVYYRRSVFMKKEEKYQYFYNILLLNREFVDREYKNLSWVCRVCPQRTFSWRNKNNINNFWYKNVPFLELWRCPIDALGMAFYWSKWQLQLFSRFMLIKQNLFKVTISYFCIQPDLIPKNNKH